MKSLTKTLPLGKTNLARQWDSKTARGLFPCTAGLQLEADSFHVAWFTVTISIYDDKGFLLFQTPDPHILSEFPDLDPIRDTLIYLYDLCRNGIHAGNPNQEQTLRAGWSEGRYQSLDNEQDRQKRIDYLTEQNQYLIQLTDKTYYRYGHGWIGKPMDDADLFLLLSLFDT